MTKTRESITGFTGPMFAKKTLLMLHEISAAEATGRRVILFKPDIDDRYGKNIVRSRAGGKHIATPIDINHPEIIYDILDRRRLPVDIIAFDEIQFFKPSVVKVVRDISQSGIQVVYSALNRNYRGDTFSTTIEKILPITTNLTVAEAKCMFPLNGNRWTCGADAQMTQRLINGEPDSYHSPTVIIEKPDTAVTYQARCLEHWKVPDLPTNRRINPHH